MEGYPSDCYGYKSQKNQLVVVDVSPFGSHPSSAWIGVNQPAVVAADSDLNCQIQIAK